MATDALSPSNSAPITARTSTILHGVLSKSKTAAKALGLDRIAALFDALEKRDWDAVASTLKQLYTSSVASPEVRKFESTYGVSPSELVELTVLSDSSTAASSSRDTTTQKEQTDE